MPNKYIVRNFQLRRFAMQLETLHAERWGTLQGASPCRVRANHPSVSGVVPVAEQCLGKSPGYM